MLFTYVLYKHLGRCCQSNIGSRQALTHLNHSQSGYLVNLKNPLINMHVGYIYYGLIMWTSMVTVKIFILQINNVILFFPLLPFLPCISADIG